MSVGPACRVPTKFTPTYGARARGRLLVEDELFGRRGAAAAVLLRPVQTRVAGVEQTPLPIGVPLASFGPRVARRLGRERGECCVEPRAQVGTKRFVGVRVTQLHEAGSLRVDRGGASPSHLSLGSPHHRTRQAELTRLNSPGAVQWPRSCPRSSASTTTSSSPRTSSSAGSRRSSATPGRTSSAGASASCATSAAAPTSRPSTPTARRPTAGSTKTSSTSTSATSPRSASTATT